MSRHPMHTDDADDSRPLPRARDTSFAGGRVFVSRGAAGWDVTHEPAAGGSFGVDWQLHRSNAVKAGTARALKFGAALYVEQPVQQAYHDERIGHKEP